MATTEPPKTEKPAEQKASAAPKAEGQKKKKRRAQPQPPKKTPEQIAAAEEAKKERKRKAKEVKEKLKQQKEAKKRKLEEKKAAAEKPKKEGEKKRPPVPETLLKHRRSLKKLEELRKEKILKGKKKQQLTRRIIYKRAEQYVKEYRMMERNKIRLRRMAKNTGTFYVEPEPKLALVIRIRGINGVAPKTKKILRLLRLRQLHNAVFVRLNKPLINMLKLVEPYVTYGYPNLKTVKELIYKRGFGKIKGQRIPLTDNRLIEDNLGKFNILCMEDIIHEIYTVGPNFKKVNAFLWPFKLSSPTGGFVKKRVHFVEGGDAGNREKYINELVRRMN